MGVPNNVVIPFTGVEFDNSIAVTGVSQFPPRALIIGQKLATGTAVSGKVYSVSNLAQIDEWAGVGASVYQDVVAFRKNVTTVPLDVILISDPSGSTASVATVAISGAATASGEVAMYVNGTRYATSVAVGDDEDDISQALVALVNADSASPVTAADSTASFTLTSNNKGAGVGDIDVRFNYNSNEVFPAGITGTVVIAAGTGSPAWTDFSAGIGSTWYQVISGPYNDSTFLTGFQDWADVQGGVTVMKESSYFTGMRGDKASLISFATNGARNSQWVNFLDCNAIPSCISKRSAAVAGATIQSVIDNDVAVPLHRMTLVGELALEGLDIRPQLPDRNELALAGISTFSDDLGVQTEATVTMYLKNEAGGSDTSYAQQNTFWQLLFSRYTFRQKILQLYPRAKLMNNTDKVRSLTNVVTPIAGKATACAWFRELESQGILENFDQFKKDVRCVRDTTNPNKLLWYLPIDLVNQYIVGSADMAFILQGAE